MLQTLRDHFGHNAFREGQEAIVTALLEGRSALAVFPTGGGKSICYQLPALMLDGLTLVVSPLIALMRDQVEALEKKGIAAARLDSTLDADELRAVDEKLSAGTLKLLYVAPERFAKESFRERLKKLPIALVAIDEAHCISEWGHNFRPDYLKLAKICRWLKAPRVLALTATATPKVARDIRKHFRIAAADHVQLSFHRKNLELKITPCEKSVRKSYLLEKLHARTGSVVVYVTRQETAEEVATFLTKNGMIAQAYHAGLNAEFRAEAQRAFMENEVRIIVATIAFGMGIDKANIRTVIHYNLPKSLENYAQEIGRAGRDGNAAVCEMLACADDLTVLENFIYSDTPSPQALRNVLDRILRLGKDFDVSLYDLSTTCDIRQNVISTVLTYLEMDGLIEATGVFYQTYRVKFLRTQSQILAGRPSAERKRMEQLLAQGEAKRGWSCFEPSIIAEELGISRTKIVAMISDLEKAGDVLLETSGVRHGYRLRKTEIDMSRLTAGLIEKFQAREQADLTRIKQVLDLSASRNCITNTLTKHFGETLPELCGHCDRCAGLPAKRIRRKASRKVGSNELSMIQQLVSESHAALGSPRQLARFLCGMTSPAAMRARLTRHTAYGLLADLSFAEVCVIAEALV